MYSVDGVVEIGVFSDDIAVEHVKYVYADVICIIWICLYVYIHTWMCIYVYIRVCVCVCLYIQICCVHIHLDT